MKKITIVDYGCGNILSLRRGIQEVGYSSQITNDSKKILNSDFLILPGVGAFKNAMSLLNERNLIDTLKEYVQHKKKTIFGICLGMQIFLTKSYEMGEHKGLNFIEGEVMQIRKHSKQNTVNIIDCIKFKLISISFSIKFKLFTSKKLSPGAKRSLEKKNK